MVTVNKLEQMCVSTEQLHMQLFGAGIHYLNCKATQYMGGGIRIRNVTWISSDTHCNQYVIYSKYGGFGPPKCGKSFNFFIYLMTHWLGW